MPQVFAIKASTFHKVGKADEIEGTDTFHQIYTTQFGVHKRNRFHVNHTQNRKKKMKHKDIENNKKP